MRVFNIKFWLNRRIALYLLTEILYILLQPFRSKKNCVFFFASPSIYTVKRIGHYFREYFQCTIKVCLNSSTRLYNFSLSNLYKKHHKKPRKLQYFDNQNHWFFQVVFVRQNTFRGSETKLFC